MAQHISNNEEPDRSPYGEQHVDKPRKAILGLGLLMAIALALYGFNAAHRAEARQHSAAASQTQSWQTNPSPSNGSDTAHLAPREDNSLR